MFPDIFGADALIPLGTGAIDATQRVSAGFSSRAGRLARSRPLKPAPPDFRINRN